MKKLTKALVALGVTAGLILGTAMAANASSTGKTANFSVNGKSTVYYSATFNNQSGSTIKATVTFHKVSGWGMYDISNKGGTAAYFVTPSGAYVYASCGHTIDITGGAGTLTSTCSISKHGTGNYQFVPGTWQVMVGGAAVRMANHAVKTYNGAALYATVS